MLLLREVKERLQTMSKDWSKWSVGGGQPEAKKGCSIAFFVMLGAMLVFLLVMYIIYRLS